MERVYPPHAFHYDFRFHPGSDGFETWKSFENALEEYCAAKDVSVMEGLRVATNALLQGATPRNVASVDDMPAVREAYHRVRNEFQMLVSIMGRMRRRPEGPAEDACGACQSYVMAMAHLNELLEKSGGETVELGEKISHICGFFLEFSQVGERVSIDIDVEPVRVAHHVARAAGLILNETLTNALKYAFPAGRQGRIQVVLRKSPDGTIRLSIADDGVGAASDGTAGTGLRLIGALAAQAGGRLRRIATLSGFCVECEFPPDERIAR